MQVLSAPFTLRAARVAFWASALLAAAETLVVSRAPWWRMPYRDMLVSAAAAIAVTGPLGWWMSRGRNWAWSASAVISALWLLLTLGMSLRMRSPSLGYFTIFLGVYLTAVLAWLRAEMGRSYLDPELRWFQGLPKAIPEVSCELGSTAFRVCRLDREGTLIFASDGKTSERQALDAAVASGNTELVFRFRARVLRCAARPMSRLDRAVGAGFRFGKLVPDTRKELGDFIEMLEGEGYVG
ncbi:MAG: hypothetical protein NDJ89_05950 [Oligoflexia bacterium]|nr:hypothetical protein [Oligoflexia bacterium]